MPVFREYLFIYVDFKSQSRGIIIRIKSKVVLRVFAQCRLSYHFPYNSNIAEYLRVFSKSNLLNSNVLS